MTCWCCGPDKPDTQFRFGSSFQCDGCRLWFPCLAVDAERIRNQVTQNNVRARRYGRVERLESYEWTRIVFAAAFNCEYCGQFLGVRGTIEHIRPLVKNGSNDKINIAVACRACNSSKHDRLWKPKRELDLTPLSLQGFLHCEVS